MWCYPVPHCLIDDEKYQKYRLFPGDVLIIRMADPGKVGIIEQEVNAIFASYLIRLTITDQRLSPYYLFYTLLDSRYQGYITGASTGTTRKSASAGVIADYEVLIPPPNLRRRFEDFITAFRKSLNNLLVRNTILRRTRDLLLPRLISGEVDVAELEIAGLETPGAEAPGDIQTSLRDGCLALKHQATFKRPYGTRGSAA